MVFFSSLSLYYRIHYTELWDILHLIIQCKTKNLIWVFWILTQICRTGTKKKITESSTIASLYTVQANPDVILQSLPCGNFREYWLLTSKVHNGHTAFKRYCTFDRIFLCHFFWKIIGFPFYFRKILWPKKSEWGNPHAESNVVARLHF